MQIRLYHLKKSLKEKKINSALLFLVLDFEKLFYT